MDEDEQRAIQYLRRAEEVRAMAETMTDEKMREILLAVAEDYESLAEGRRRMAENNKLLRNTGKSN